MGALNRSLFCLSPSFTIFFCPTVRSHHLQPLKSTVGINSIYVWYIRCFFNDDDFIFSTFDLFIIIKALAIRCWHDHCDVGILYFTLFSYFHIFHTERSIIFLLFLFGGPVISASKFSYFARQFLNVNPIYMKIACTSDTPKNCFWLFGLRKTAHNTQIDRETKDLKLDVYPTACVAKPLKAISYMSEAEIQRYQYGYRCLYTAAYFSEKIRYEMYDIGRVEKSFHMFFTSLFKLRDRQSWERERETKETVCNARENF